MKPPAEGAKLDTKYELVILLHPDLEIDLDKPLKKIEDLIKASGGKTSKTDNWGKRKLAYGIKKQDFAIYIYWEIDMVPDGVAKLDRGLTILDEVLRHLITKHVEPPVQKPKKESKSTEKKSDKEEAK